MKKKLYMDNRPFTVTDSSQMQDWIEEAIKDNIKNIYSFGILEGLQVEANAGFQIRVVKGKALDSSFNFINIDTNQSLTIEGPDLTLNRIDLITLKYKTDTTDNIDTTNRYGRGASWVISKNILDKYELKIIKGTPSSSPTMPSIPAGELALASIYIGVGQANIQTANITDRRTIAQFLNKPLIQDTTPTGTFKEGQIWHSPASLETKMLINGSFIPVGGIPPVISETQPTTNLREGLIWHKPSTKETKFYLNGIFHQAGGAALLPYENSVVLTEDSLEVAHGVSSFVKDRDILIAYKNTVHLQKGVDYDFNEDGSKIVSLKGVLTKDTRIDFLVLYSSPLTDALNTVRLEKGYTVIGTETNIPVGVPEYNKDTDVLDVIFENTPLVKGNNYTLNPNGISIDLLFTPEAGQKLQFYVWKKVRIAADKTDGSLLQDNSVNNLKLASDIKIGSLSTLLTSVKTSITASINSLFDTVDTHVKNNNIHVTATDKSNWNNHMNDATVHVTEADKNKWNSAIFSNEKGVANGIATLDSNGKVLQEQVPKTLFFNEEWSKLSDIILSSDMARIDFTNISGYKKYKIRAESLQTIDTSARFLYMQFNDITTAVYIFGGIYGTNTSFGSVNVSNYITLGGTAILPVTTSKLKTNFEMDIFNKQGDGITFFAKGIQSDHLSWQGGGAVYNDNTTILNKISIYANASLIKTGARFEIWGCK